MSTPIVPIQPAPRTRPVDSSGFASPEFQRWYNSILVATEQVATNTSAVTGNTQSLGALAIEVAALQLAAKNAAVLTAANDFTAVNTFKLAPVFADPAGTRYALGLGSAATYPASFFAPAGTGTSLTLETNGTANTAQTLLNLAAGTGMTITQAAGTVTFTSSASAGNQSVSLNGVSISDDYSWSMNQAKQITVNGT